MRRQANKFDTNIPRLSKVCVKSLALPIQGQHGDIPALLWASQLETGLQLFPFQKHLSKQQQSQRQVSPVSVGDSSRQKIRRERVPKTSTGAKRCTCAGMTPAGRNRSPLGFIVIRVGSAADCDI